MKNIDKKGLGWFLGLTFGVTYIIEGLMALKGVMFVGRPALEAQLIVAGLMFVPGIASIIVRIFITKEGFKTAGLNFGKLKYYRIAAVTIILLFLVAYGLTAVLVQKPDFSLISFMKLYGIKYLPAPAMVMISGLFLGSVTIYSIINSIPALGEELGWRGYLLPVLLPLGKMKALVWSGLIWGLWHAPLVLMGFHYGKNGVMGVVFFTILVTLLGIYVGYMRLISGSVILAAFIHGAFNSQFYGVWQVIFPTVNPFWGGITGIIGIGLLAIMAGWIRGKAVELK